MRGLVIRKTSEFVCGKSAGLGRKQNKIKFWNYRKQAMYTSKIFK